MGDMGDDFRAWDEAKKAKKQSNLQWSTQKLESLGVAFERKNCGNHLIITHENHVVDFWPSTGKYGVRGSQKYGRGIRNLLKAIGVNDK